MSQEIPIAILSLHPSGSREAAGIKKHTAMLCAIKKGASASHSAQFTKNKKPATSI